jgi:vacuolar-type H+-ATPase subunit C/Vma6
VQAVAPSDYANARVRARAGRLAGDRGLRDALLARGEVELAAPANLAEEARRVLAFLSGRPRRLVAALLRLEDGPALEAVLRGLVLRLAPERIIAGAAPSPGLPAELLGALAALPAPERSLELLADRDPLLAAAAAAAVAAVRDEPRLLRLGLALQRTLVAGVAGALSGCGEDPALAREVLRRHVDHANATTLLALVSPPHPGELFLPGGRLDPAAFADLAALAPEPRREALAAWLVSAGSSWRAAPAARLARGAGAELLADPARASEHLARLRERWLGREARARPFSIAVPLAYFAARSGEARRLRLIALGRVHGLPADALLDLLES